MELGQYEDKIQTKIEEWNTRIEQLKVCVQDAGPEKRKEYEEEMDSLITTREAARRGLLRMTESGDELCASCPAEPTGSKQSVPEEESWLEEIAPEAYDVVRSPRSTYGRDD